MAKDILYPLRRLHGILHEECLRQKKKSEYRKQYIQTFRNNPRTVLLLMTPEHGNLGDHAIAMAIFTLLKKEGIGWIEITDQQLMTMRMERLLGVMNGYPILICGGGNMGTLWMNVETLMRDVVQCNPKSPVAILPNTVFYEDTQWGKQELEKAKYIYNRHNQLQIYAREKVSFDYMKPIFPNVQLVPDMVLSMRCDTFKGQRDGCILCLRSDREKTRTEEQNRIIRRQAEMLFGEQLVDTDTVLPTSIAPQNRDKTVLQKLEEFASAQLVITDRLHGMIFCAITGTPCVVVNSKSPKVRGCYEWIKHLDYIRFVDKPEDIVTAYREIPEGPHYYDNSNLTHYYQTLAEDIQSIWR